jgi:cyclic-di-GMP-binding protein
VGQGKNKTGLKEPINKYTILCKAQPLSVAFFYICKKQFMPSFDIVSKVDLQTLDNAINVVSKEVTNRFDFKGSHVVIELNKKDFKLNLEADSAMKLQQIIDVLISRSMKQGLAAEVYDLSKDPYPSGKVTKQEVLVRNGIKQEDAKKIVKLIKDSGLKVQVAIMDDIIRVTGKKIDDLQDVIQASKTWNLGLALQFVNMKS